MALPISNQEPPEPSAVSKLIDSSGFKTAAEATAIEILHNLRYQHDWTDLRLHVIHVHDRSRSGSGLGLRSIDDDNDDDDDDAAPSFTMVNLEGDSYLSQHYQSQRNHTSTPTTSYESPSGSGNTIQLISGLPPRHSYIHPDLQLHLLKHAIPETSLAVQREFVLPLSTAEKWTLRRFCAVFDSLSEREKIVVNVDNVAATATAAAAAGAGGGGGGGGNSATRANGSAAPPTGLANRARTPTPSYEHKDQKRVVLGMRAREGRGGDGTIVYYIMQEGEVKPRQNG